MNQNLSSLPLHKQFYVFGWLQSGLPAQLNPLDSLKPLLSFNNDTYLVYFIVLDDNRLIPRTMVEDMSLDSEVIGYDRCCHFSSINLLLSQHIPIIDLN